MKRRRTFPDIVLVAGYLTLAICVAAFSPGDAPRHLISCSPKAAAKAPFVETEILTPASRSSSVHSRTVLENSVAVEWERRTELERRIEDGVLYEHFEEWSDSFGLGRKHKSPTGRACMQDEDTPSKRGVFCGYRATKDEYDRLKNADPNA